MIDPLINGGHVVWEVTLIPEIGSDLTKLGMTIPASLSVLLEKLVLYSIRMQHSSDCHLLKNV